MYTLLLFSTLFLACGIGMMALAIKTAHDDNTTNADNDAAPVFEYVLIAVLLTVQAVAMFLIWYANH